MNYGSRIAEYVGRRYDTWRVDQLTRREARRQLRLKRRAERDDELVYKWALADLKARHKSAVAAEKSAKKIARDQQRGYSVDPKRVIFSTMAEFGVAGLSFSGQYLLALKTGADSHAVHQMILAPAAYAIVELSRVPLALSVRIHRQWLWRSAALLGVIGAAGITVKSMSQLGDLTYAPRQNEVVVAHEKLDLARAADERITQRIAIADALVKQQLSQQQSAVNKEEAASVQLASLPRRECHQVTYKDARISKTSTSCSPDPRTAPLTSNMTAAQFDLTSARAAYEEALTDRGKLSPATADEALADAQAAYREAVRKSQLNDFVSMVWGIAPGDVTEAMVAQFLRWFVFGAAICVALAATMIAFTAITRVKPAKPNTVALDESHFTFLNEAIEALDAEARAKANRAKKDGE